MTSRALTRYYSILEGETEARYLASKNRCVDVDLGAGTNDLWTAHEGLLRTSKTSPSKHSLLDLKAELGRRMLRSCTLCERGCHADRIGGRKGHCGVLGARISTEFLHMGEEPDLVPSYTIFFTGCTFNCVFCQNWDISTRPDSGEPTEPRALARRIESRTLPQNRVNDFLDEHGRAKNVNWVGGDPTSDLPFILEVLQECSVNVPQVWNSNMYLSEQGMSLLDGVIDIYLTDFKYGNDKCALRLSNARDYMRVVCRNHAQARENGEMIIRHLVLPGHLKCCTRPALTWIAENLEGVLVNLMAQYRPEYRAKDFPELAKPIRMNEYNEALEIAEGLGLDLCE